MLTCSVDAEVVTNLAETDMLLADLERANSRVAAIERRNVSSSFPWFGSDINPRIGTAAGGNRSRTDGQ